MRALHRLTALQIKLAKPGSKLLDGGGLWLVKYRSGSAQWVLRVTVGGRRREMGLGSLSTVSLKAARAEAARWRAVVTSGHDPIKVRAAERRAAAKVRPTLAAVTAECFEARKASLKADGTASRWLSALENHVLPKLGKTAIEDVDQNDLRAVLAPVWRDQPPTARAALGKLKLVFEHAVAKGLAVDITAPEKARVLLGKSAHVVVNRASLDWREVPAFYSALAAEDGIAALALRFLVLTAARSAEVRGLMLDEIEGNVWVIPAHRTKSGKLHRVALSAEALAVIEAARPFVRGGLLFASQRGAGGGPLSDTTLSRVLHSRHGAATVHGFRSSFRTWCSEATDVPREVAEAALAHTSDGSNAVERSYRRTDFLERRQVLMANWADVVTGKVSGKVVLLHGHHQ